MNLEGFLTVVGEKSVEKSFLDEDLWFSDENLKQKRRTRVQKVKNHDFDRKSDFSVFISIGKKPSRLTSKKSSQSRRLFTSGSWKKFKMKTLQLFHTCTTFSHPNFVHFHICRPEWKLFSFLKQKWKRFVTKIPKKWKMTRIFPCCLCFPTPNENHFFTSSCRKPCANQWFN